MIEGHLAFLASLSVTVREKREVLDCFTPPPPQCKDNQNAKMLPFQQKRTKKDFSVIAVCAVQQEWKVSVMTSNVKLLLPLFL
jgi:hypothetical protein